MYHYSVTTQKPTSVKQAIRCNFTAPDALNVVIAAVNHLEVHVVTPHGLAPLFDIPMYGRISILQKIRPLASSVDYILLLSQSFQVQFINFYLSFFVLVLYLNV